MGQEQSKSSKKKSRKNKSKGNKTSNLIENITIDNDSNFDYFEYGDIQIQEAKEGKPVIKIMSWNVLAECYKFGMTDNYKKKTLSTPQSRGKFIVKINSHKKKFEKKS